MLKTITSSCKHSLVLEDQQVYLIAQILSVQHICYTRQCSRH